MEAVAEKNPQSAEVVVESQQGRIPYAELDQRVIQVAKLLAKGSYKSEIKKFCKKNYGVCVRTAESYIARAKSMIMAEAMEDVSVSRAMSAAFYRQMMANEEVNPITRLRARENLDKLLGLITNTNVFVVNNSGEKEEPKPDLDEADDMFRAMAMEMTEEELRIMISANERVKQRRISNSAPLPEKPL